MEVKVALKEWVLQIRYNKRPERIVYTCSDCSLRIDCQLDGAIDLGHQIDDLSPTQELFNELVWTSLLTTAVERANGKASINQEKPATSGFYELASIKGCITLSPINGIKGVLHGYKREA